MREEYDRLRIGMTPAQVSQAMGSPPSDKERVLRVSDLGPWERVADENYTNEYWFENTEVWRDGSVATIVYYRGGLAVVKMMVIRVPPWKAKVRGWLNWLRGLWL